MKWLLIAVVFISTLTSAQPGPKAIVEKSNEKIKALKSIRLNVAFLDKNTGEVSVAVIISRERPFPVFGVSKLKMTGIAITPEGSSAVSMAYDGNTFSYIDAGKNELVVIENPTYPKIGRTGQLNYGMAIPALYYEGYGFDSIMAQAGSYELLNDTVIFSRAAYQVYIVRHIHSQLTGETYEQGTTFFFDRESYMLLGSSFPGSTRYYKIMSTDEVYTAADFSLASVVPPGR